MTATCLSANTGELADHQRGRFTDIEESYALTIGQRYLVMGIGVWETVLHTLVRDDDGLPCWCPIGLFDLRKQPVPMEWSFALEDGIRASGRALWTKWVARWGYQQLVEDPAHSDGLMERDPIALEIFDREMLRQQHDEEAWPS